MLTNPGIYFQVFLKLLYISVVVIAILLLLVASIVVIAVVVVAVVVYVVVILLFLLLLLLLFQQLDQVVRQRNLHSLELFLSCAQKQLSVLLKEEPSTAEGSRD